MESQKNQDFEEQAVKNGAHRAPIQNFGLRKLAFGLDDAPFYNGILIPHFIPAAKPQVSGARFGRLFPDLVVGPYNVLPLNPDGTPVPQLEADLAALANEMKDFPNPAAPNSPQDAAGDATFSAGLTYLGQFIDHDISLDLTSSLVHQNDPNAIANFREPNLNLDLLYGGGPAASPHLYVALPDPNNPRGGTTLLVGNPPNASGGYDNFRNDLPRNFQGQALVGDPREDENLLVAQTHVAFARFHNAVVERLIPGGLTGAVLFEAARQLVRWHYQWIVVHEFLRTLCQPAVLDDVIQNGNLYYKITPGETSFIPIEFSVAAYRLGHSMVRESYSVNRIFNAQPLRDMFTFTHGFGVTQIWRLDWQRFFALPNTDPGIVFNNARKVDTKIAEQLHNLPPIQAGGGPVSLPQRNLKRGYLFQLPSGQSVAQKMGATVLTASEITGDSVILAANSLLRERTPLWFYILREAEVQENGNRLGQVGSRIVAEVIMGLLQNDPSSYFSQPNWLPTLGPIAEQFSMADLLQFAGVISEHP